MVPLGQVATLRYGGAPNQIDRRNLERVATIEGSYQGRPLTGVVSDVQKRLKALDLPPGYRLSFGGEQESFAETVGYMVESLLLAIIFIYLILASPVRQLHPAAGHHVLAAPVAGRRHARR